MHRIPSICWWFLNLHLCQDLSLKLQTYIQSWSSVNISIRKIVRLTQSLQSTQQQGWGSNHQVHGLQAAWSPDQEADGHLWHFLFLYVSPPSPSSSSLIKIPSQPTSAHLYPVQASTRYCSDNCNCFLIGFLLSFLLSPDFIHYIWARSVFSKQKFCYSFPYLKFINGFSFCFGKTPQFWRA